MNELDAQQLSSEYDDARPSPATASDPPPVRLDGIHVLVVDDEADARRMLLEVLERVGARVTTAGSAGEALAILTDSTEEKNGPEVLLATYVGMPEQNGYDLIREVRRCGHSVERLPAVALTAFAHIDPCTEMMSEPDEAPQAAQCE